MSKRFALIVEDDQDVAELCVMALQPIGFKTEIVADGRSALARLEAVTPDLVVLDLHLPQVSGMEVLDKIRSDPRLAETRIVVTTADTVAASAVEDRVNLVLIKPVSLIQVRDLSARLGFPEAAGG